MRPIRPKPLIPTLIVIYSTSYLLVNKRLVVKLQKPYRASSGIVSIIATNQTKQGRSNINHAFPDTISLFFILGRIIQFKVRIRNI
ncbi:hypothetical protein B4902_00070 [Yersinia frederiksenii]|nr:hypothetical protein B4902_00070 [Yersinia frederiksenii]